MDEPRTPSKLLGTIYKPQCVRRKYVDHSWFRIPRWRSVDGRQISYFVAGSWICHGRSTSTRQKDLIATLWVGCQPFSLTIPAAISCTQAPTHNMGMHCHADPTLQKKLEFSAGIMFSRFSVQLRFYCRRGVARVCSRVKNVSGLHLKVFREGQVRSFELISLSVSWSTRSIRRTVASPPPWEIHG